MTWSAFPLSCSLFDLTAPQFGSRDLNIHIFSAFAKMGIVLAIMALVATVTLYRKH